MDSTTFTPPLLTMDKDQLTSEEGMHSLYEALQSLPDCRRGQGKRYSLALLLCLLMLAKLAGQTSLSGATEWIRHRAGMIAEQFGLARKKMPCQMTSTRTLNQVDPHLLDEVLAAFFIRLRS